ncbi:MAG: hypothetical protein K0Q83_3783 [Deltaproteobacteria bacterium]|nr:hypothetical protein [Deltaproteobacteria bacterium]
MRKVAIDDIVGLPGYERIRQDLRRRIIELKQKRRVSLGDRLSLVFENRDTVIFQIQEMLRVENISDLDKIRQEIATYNQLIPDSGELSATLFLEIEDQTHLREELVKFQAIEEAISLRIAAHRLEARFEPGRSKEDKISAVHYIRFRFDDQALEAFISGTRTELVIDHRNYQAAVVLQPETQRSLGEDLTT